MLYSINSVRIIEFLYLNKMDLDPCLKPNPKINSRWMVELKCKSKDNKLLRAVPGNNGPTRNRRRVETSQSVHRKQLRRT